MTGARLHPDAILETRVSTPLRPAFVELGGRFFRTSVPHLAGLRLESTWRAERTDASRERDWYEFAYLNVGGPA